MTKLTPGRSASALVAIALWAGWMPLAARADPFASCRAASAQWCARVVPGEGRLLQCLVVHWADLPDPCRADLLAVEAGVTPPVPAGPGPLDVCRADLDRHCGGQQPSLRVYSECLFEHLDELAPDCRAEVEKGYRKVQEFMRVCGTDALIFCGDVPQSQRAVLECLAGNRERVARECRDWIEDAESRLLAFRTACSAEMDSLCAGPDAGGGRGLVCLAEHWSQLSAACREALERIGRLD